MRFLFSYPEPGSNRHTLRYWCLRPTRLPIPPSGLICECKGMTFYNKHQIKSKKKHFRTQILLKTCCFGVAGECVGWGVVKEQGCGCVPALWIFVVNVGV